MAQDELIEKLAKESTNLDGMLTSLLDTIEKERGISAWEWAENHIQEVRVERDDYY